ncbi:MAG: hypothetical protein F6K14_00065 [Symploca sp. SIO2C1]|nr:hypothetical protein [Symploca sp. SIO2C1]
MNTEDFRYKRPSRFNQAEDYAAKRLVLVRFQPPPVKMLFLIVIGSFAMGLIPILYGSTVAQTQPHTATSLGEAGVWTTLGERD